MGWENSESVCWIAAAARSGFGAFLTVTRLDGALGTGQEHTLGVVAGGLPGLVKTLRLEWEDTFCRAVDLSPRLDSHTAAAHIVAALHDPHRGLAAVALGRAGRTTLVADPLPAAVDQAGNLGGATNIPYTVTPVPLVITASSGTMTSGTTPPTIPPSYSGFVGSDNSGSLTTQPTCTTAATNASPVGNYSSSCSGAVDPNYTISYMAGSVAVTAASATISLGNLAQTYTGGALSPTVTTSPSGLSYLLAGAPDTNAGSYPVTATITNPNYTSTPASGTFVISPASATISLGNLTQSYTGSPLSPTVTTSPSGLTYLLTGAPDTSVGYYPVTATITNPNYSSTPASGTFVITGAIASISPTSLNFGTVENGRTVYKTVTLTNSGNVSMTITSIKISGGSDPDDFKETNKCGKSLAASASCVITVSYAADRDNYKGGTANLVITDSAAGSPQSVSISGKSER